MKDFDQLKTATLIATVVLSICTIHQAPLLAQSFPQWGDLRPGGYAVGFTVNHEYDTSSRSFAKPGAEQDKVKQPRPIQISIWYPSEKTANPQFIALPRICPPDGH